MGHTEASTGPAGLSTVPEVGGMNPDSIESTVDFPEPDRPTIAVIWPRSTSSDTPPSTTTSPNDLVTLRRVQTAASCRELLLLR